MLFSFIYISNIYFQSYISIFETILPLKRIYLFALYLLLGGGMVYWISKNKNVYLGFVVFVSSVLFLSLGELLLITFTRHYSLNQTNENHLTSFKFNHKPNIYFLLVDAYPRHDMLLEERDNRSFLNYFSDRGFIVADQAYSNYPETKTSLSATFQMSYLKPGEVTKGDILSPNKQVFKVLKDNQYSIIMLPSAYSSFNGRNAADYLICRSKIASIMLSDTSRGFFNKSSVGDHIVGLFGEYSYFSMDELNKIFLIKRTTPKFVFMHFIHLHDYIFDKNCGIDCYKKRESKKTGDLKINSFCIENFVKKIVTLLISRDPNAIIIVQS